MEESATINLAPQFNGTNCVAVYDPIASQAAPAWLAEKQPTAGNGLANSFYTTNTIVGSAPALSPPEDMDQCGNVSTNFMVMPAPKSPSPTGPYPGFVRSVVQLGLVSSGSDYAYQGVTKPYFGAPFRTILDLFSAPLNTHTFSATAPSYYLIVIAQRAVEQGGDRRGDLQCAGSAECHDDRD